MKKRIIFSFISVLVVFSGIFAFMIISKASAQQHRPSRQATSQIPFTQEDEVGYWQSVSCDSTLLMGVNDGNLYFRRFYVISLTDAIVRYSFYSDAGCQKPLYSFRVLASSEIGKVHTDLPQTREALIVFNTTLLTADSSQGQSILSSCGAANWIIGQEYDVTSQGCQAVGIRPRSKCIGDYELEQMKGHDLMTFGYRTENMCIATGRPTRTQTVWVKKVSPQEFQG